MRIVFIACLAFSLLAGMAVADAKVVRVRVADMAFEPAEVQLSPGDVVEWQNDDFVDHTATSGEGGFDVTIPAGKATSMVIEHAGTFPYICRYHPMMRGRLMAK